MAFRIGGLIMNNKSCEIDKCGRKQYAKGFCLKHYQQIKRYGAIRKTRRDENEFVLNCDFYEIKLCDNDCNVINTTIIDIDDYDKCKNIKWHYDNSTGYATSQINGRKLYLHRFIFGECDTFVDHIDRNKLNNRKINLRCATGSENVINQNIRSDNTSGVIGVSYYKRDGTWEAYVRVTKRTKLGRFHNFEDAVKARLNAERDIYGEFAPQKHLFEQYEIL